MRLEAVQQKLRDKNITFTYTEEDGCGSIDFMHRGLSYHIWEYADADTPVGVVTIVLLGGCCEVVVGDFVGALCQWLLEFF